MKKAFVYVMRFSVVRIYYLRCSLPLIEIHYDLLPSRHLNYKSREIYLCQIQLKCTQTLEFTSMPHILCQSHRNAQHINNDYTSFSLNKNNNNNINKHNKSQRIWVKHQRFWTFFDTNKRTDERNMNKHKKHNPQSLLGEIDREREKESMAFVISFRWTKHTKNKNQLKLNNCR